MTFASGIARHVGRWAESGERLTGDECHVLVYAELNLRREFKEILTAAELADMRIHGPRHTCATLLLAQKAAATVQQEVLGHSQITLTLETPRRLPLLDFSKRVW